MRVIDFSDPSAAFEVVHQPTSSDIKDVFVSGDTVFATGMNTFYILTTDAFESGSLVVEPPSIDSVSPPAGTVTGCDPEFVWYFTEGTHPIMVDSIEVLCNGVVYTGTDLFFDSAGSVRLPLWPSFPTDDTVVATMISFEDSSGNEALELPVSTSITIDSSPPEFSLIYPSSGDSLCPDSVIIIGNLVDIGLSGINGDSLRVVVNSVSYSTAGSYLDWSPPEFVCRPMGSFDYGDSIDVQVHAVDNLLPGECGPNTLDTVLTLIIPATGISEDRFPLKRGLTVSPNPFNDACKIDLSDYSGDSRALDIYDIRGKLVYSHEVPIESDVFLWSPSSADESGLYLISIGKQPPIKVLLVR